MEREAKSPSSSTDSCGSHPSRCSTVLSEGTAEDSSTELRLGLTAALPKKTNHQIPRDNQLQAANWPPIKHFMAAALKGRKKRPSKMPTFFIKVYMEGIPIGRKIDLYAVDGYDGLTEKISNLFTALILSSGLVRFIPEKNYMLTYEDNEGDWMMVGDVPWEHFLITVKRLKVARADKC